MFIKLVCNLQALQVLIALAAQLVGMTRRGYKISLSPQLTALAVDENSSHFSYQAAIAIPGGILSRAITSPWYMVHYLCMQRMMKIFM